MSFLTGTNVELIYASQAVGASLNTFTSEALLNTTATMGVQAHLPPDFWLPTPGSVGRGIKVVARGILSSTGTPTYTVNVRLGGAAAITGPIVLGSAAGTTGSGASSQVWQLEGDVILTAIGAAGGNSTVRGIGVFDGPGIPASANVFGGSASPGTVATVDTSITNYINVSVSCSASSASNVFALQQLLVYGLN